MTAGIDKLFASIQQSPNLASGLVDSLVGQIEAGDLAPGQRLPTEQAIMEATGVSRTVVREALASLRARGLIMTRQGLGTFVNQNPLPKSFAIEPRDLDSITEVLHLLELRLSVEVEAAGLSAVRRSEADLKRMESHLDALDAAIGTAASGAEEDYAFHGAILAATQNPYFVRFINVFHGSMIPRQRVRLDAMPPQERISYMRRIQREHRAILKAIRAGDQDAARRAVRSHLANAYQRYRGLGHDTSGSIIGQDEE